MDWIPRLAMSRATHNKLEVQRRTRIKVAARPLDSGGGGAITICLVAELSLNLHPRPGVSSCWVVLHFRTLHLQLRVFSFKLREKEMGPKANRTVPEVAFSWLLFPVTLKATLLGVLLLTSMAPAETW